MFLFEVMMVTIITEIVVTVSVAEASVTYVITCTLTVCVLVYADMASNSFFQKPCNLDIIIPSF